MTQPPEVPGPSLKDFQIGKAAISSAELSGRLGTDEGATISYREGHGFELIWWFAPDPNGPPSHVRQLDNEDLRILLDRIKYVLANPPATVDVSALEAFSDIIEGVVGAGTNLFSNVRFGQAVAEIFGGEKTVIGFLGFGVDVVGTIHDANGMVTWEHHVVPLPPGQLRPLSASERDSLKAALTDWLKDNHVSGWPEILADIS